MENEGNLAGAFDCSDFGGVCGAVETQVGEFIRKETN